MSSPAAPAPSSVVSTAGGSRVLLDVSGAGQNTTRMFTTAGPWAIDYDYRCGAQPGVFQVFVLDDHGSAVAVGPNEMKPAGSGVDHKYRVGTFALQVNSTCPTWHVVVRG